MSEIRDLVIPRGSAQSWAVRFRQRVSGVLQPLDLTGWTIGLADVAPALTGLLSAEWTDAAQGEAVIHLKAAPALPVDQAFTFRLRRVPPSGADAAETSYLFKVIAR